MTQTEQTPAAEMLSRLITDLTWLVDDLKQKSATALDAGNANQVGGYLRPWEHGLAEGLYRSRLMLEDLLDKARPGWDR